MKGSENAPPPFSWEDWYSSIGGRTIQITEVDTILNQIRAYQYPKFTGEVNPQKTFFESPASASALIQKCIEELQAEDILILRQKEKCWEDMVFQLMILMP